MPYHNYMGPGTHILENLEAGIEPVDYVDSVARQHDVNYSDPHKTRIESDIIAIKDAWKQPSFDSTAMTIGLGIRSIYDKLNPFKILNLDYNENKTGDLNKYNYMQSIIDKTVKR
jgi:hypothetical protein